MTTIDLNLIDKNLIDWRAVIERVLTGEQIKITQANVTVAELSPQNFSQKMQMPKRKIGFMKGQIRYPDDIHFGDGDVLEMFERSSNYYGGVLKSMLKENRSP